MNPFFILWTLLCTLVAGLSITDEPASTSLVKRQATLDFTSSKWIWNANTAANQVRAFRKDFSPPLGKALIGAEIIVAAANHLTFWVNGEILGTVANQAWAGRFCADLDPSFNVFAVNATSVSTNTDGAFIATILLTYSDGTTDTIVSDTTWVSSTTVPIGFADQAFDDTTWAPVIIQANFGQGTVYGNPFIPTTPPNVAFTHAEWVWTDVLSASGTVPASTRAFRRTWALPTGGNPTSADIIITAENQFTLYVNGVEIGSGTQWREAQHYTVNLAPSSTEIVVAVLASNTATGNAGVLMEMEVNMAESGRNNCTAGVYFITDVDWLSTLDGIPTGWELPGFDDSTWPTVAAEGGYPMASPWLSSVTIAAASPPINAF